MIDAADISDAAKILGVETGADNKTIDDAWAKIVQEEGLEGIVRNRTAHAAESDKIARVEELSLAVRTLHSLNRTVRGAEILEQTTLRRTAAAERRIDDLIKGFCSPFTAERYEADAKQLLTLLDRQPALAGRYLAEISPGNIARSNNLASRLFQLWPTAFIDIMMPHFLRPRALFNAETKNWLLRILRECPADQRVDVAYRMDSGLGFLMRQSFPEIPKALDGILRPADGRTSPQRRNASWITKKL